MAKTKASATTQTPLNDEVSTSFESAISELEKIVGLMETAQLPLNESLSAYQRGTALLHLCQKLLQDVEQQVRVLTESNKLEALGAYDE